jgi:hypothetical protein
VHPARVSIPVKKSKSVFSVCFMNVGLKKEAGYQPPKSKIVI